MSVVINDFELVVDPPAPAAAPAGGDGASAPAPAPAPPVRPLDLRDVLEHQARRAERLRAH